MMEWNGNNGGSCRCGARWAGVTAAHCAAAGCHQTFGGVGLFDDHRKAGQCVEPLRLDLVLTEDMTGAPVWRKPAVKGSDSTLAGPGAAEAA